MAETMRILSIDAGGVRGLLPALLLSEIEARTGKQVWQMFDLVTGTGTGALLAIGLTIPARSGNPLPAAKLQTIFEQPKRSLYRRSWLRKFAAHLRGVQPNYSSNCLRVWAQHHYMDTTLSEAKTGLLLPVYDLERRRPYFFKSWKAQGQQLKGRDEIYQDRNFRVRDLIGATMAEPGLFDPKVVGSQSGKRLTVVDGNLFAANPGLCGLVSSHRLRPDAKTYRMVSLGTGQDTKGVSLLQARGWDRQTWQKKMLNLTLDGMQGTVDYQLREILGEENYLRVNPELALRKALRGPDDLRLSHRDAVRQAAKRAIEKDETFVTILNDLNRATTGRTT